MVQENNTTSTTTRCTKPAHACSGASSGMTKTLFTRNSAAAVMPATSA